MSELVLLLRGRVVEIDARKEKEKREKEKEKKNAEKKKKGNRKEGAESWEEKGMESRVKLRKGGN